MPSIRGRAAFRRWHTMDETRDETNGTADETRDVAANPKARSWSAAMPALRLHRRQRAFVSPLTEPHGDEAAASRATDPPRFLRAERALAGLTMLALAWLGLYLVVMLVVAAGHVLPIQRVSVGLLIALLEVFAACWIGLAALGCLFAGAFSMMLALTRRGW